MIHSLDMQQVNLHVSSIFIPSQYQSGCSSSLETQFTWKGCPTSAIRCSASFSAAALEVLVHAMAQNTIAKLKYFEQCIMAHLISNENSGLYFISYQFRRIACFHLFTELVATTLIRRKIRFGLFGSRYPYLIFIVSQSCGRHCTGTPTVHSFSLSLNLVSLNKETFFGTMGMDNIYLVRNVG